MKYFFSLILTVCAEIPKVSAQTAKDESFEPLNDVHLTAPRKNGVDFVLSEIYGFFRTIERSILRRDGIFRFHHSNFFIFSKPRTFKVSSNSFCKFQFDKRENFL